MLVIVHSHRRPTLDRLLEFAVTLDSQERLISAHVAALWLGVDLATLQRWHDHDSGPPVTVTITGRTAYWSSALEEWQNQLGGRLDWSLATSG